MPINTAQIDEKIRKLQELKRLASDPEMAQLMESLVTSNGFTRDAITDKATTRKPRSRRRATGTKKGDLLHSIRKTINSFERRFTSARVLEQLHASGFNFTAAKPVVAVNGALRSLTRKGEIKVALVGKGRTPNEYERVHNKGTGD